jgi:hypothetical protein
VRGFRMRGALRMGEEDREDRRRKNLEVILII